MRQQGGSRAALLPASLRSAGQPTLPRCDIIEFTEFAAGVTVKLNMAMLLITHDLGVVTCSADEVW
jgi:hypothetical protein